MKKHVLAINPDDLLTALRERSPQVESWLDRETGEIYQTSALFADDEVEDDPHFIEAMQQSPSRFLRLPILPASVGYAAMRGFHATVSDAQLSAQLTAALARQRAFFHFQDALMSAPLEYQRWQQWNRAHMLTWAEQWLSQQGVLWRFESE